MHLTPDDEIRTCDELAAFVRDLHQDYLRRGHEALSAATVYE
ncbi:hypothetical protein [Streptomyces sp. NPDC048623]